MLAQHLHYIPLITLLICAAIEDTRRRRVSNWLTFSLFGSGLVLSLTPWGLVPFTTAVMGSLVGLGLGLFMFAMTILGGADGKLLIGIGAWLGPWGLALVFVVAAVLAMIMAIALSISHRYATRLMRDGALLVMDLVAQQQPAPAAAQVSQSNDVPRPPTIPYALALLLATESVIVVQSLQGR